MPSLSDIAIALFIGLPMRAFCALTERRTKWRSEYSTLDVETRTALAGEMEWP
jgi:hypothetical protein